MTVQEKLIQQLTDNGMFDSQAKDIMELAKPEIESAIKDYKITWDSPWQDYPVSLYALWYLTMKPIALKWIEDNAPNAWFKPMFS